MLHILLWLVGGFVAFNVALFAVTIIWIARFSYKEHLPFWRNAKSFFYYTKFTLNTAYAVLKLTNLEYKRIMNEQRKNK